MSKELERVQAAGVVVNVATTLIAAAQAMAVFRILTPEEVGLAGIVTAIGLVAGTAQYFGVGVGALQRIAATDDAASAQRILWTALAARLVISIPVAGALFALARPIAGAFTEDPRVTFGLRIFAGTLVLQGLAEIFQFTLSGRFRFRAFYTVKLLNALANLACIAGGTWARGIEGYFLGTLGAWGFAALSTTIALRRVLPGPWALPTRADFADTFGQLFRTGLYAQLAKMCLMLFLQMPILALGRLGTTANTGLVKFAISTAGYLYVVTDAMIAANITYMSRWFAEGVATARAQFVPNFERVIWGLSGIFLALLCGVEEITWVVGGPQYGGAVMLLALALTAVYLNSQMNVIATAVAFASEDLKGYLAAFVWVGVSGFGLIAGAAMWRPEEPEWTILAAIACSAVGVLIAATRAAIRPGFLPYSGKSLAILFLTLAGAAGLLRWRPELPVRAALVVGIGVGFVVLGRALHVIDAIGVARTYLSKLRTG